MKEEDEHLDLDIIIKADVQGSVEAIIGSIEKLNSPENKVSFKVIHAGVGPINETDVMLATASQALIVGFNVNAESNVRKMAETESIELRFYQVIYNLLEELEAFGKGMLAPELQEVALGTATVRSTFKVPRIGTVAGCYVNEGKITRQALIRLYRQGKMIYEGSITSLKRFKDDVKEVAQGYECGINLENYNDIKEEDVLEAYEVKEVENK